MTTTHRPDPGGIATIAISKRIFVQGVFVRQLDAATITVRVGDQDFTGQLLRQQM